MKKKARKIILAVLLLLALFAAGCGFFGLSRAGNRSEGNGKVRVMLEKAEGLVIKSSAFVDVEPGGTAVFEVDIDPYYVLCGLSDGLYDETGGRIIVAGARYPTTLSVSLKKAAEENTEGTPAPETETPSETDNIPANTPAPEDETPTPSATDAQTETEAATYGPEDATPAPTDEPEGPTPTPAATATPYETEPPTPTPVPTPLEITLKDPVANEILNPGEETNSTENEIKIVYHANGGLIAGTDSETASAFFPLDYYYCANTLPDTGYFTREGYLLLGYTDRADGTGRYYGPGWNIIPGEEPAEEPEETADPEDIGEEEEQGEIAADLVEERENVVDLYCLWVPFTPEEEFSYENVSDYAVIRRYNGESDVVVIPEKIGNAKVLMIDSAAFMLKPVKEVCISKYVEVVGEGAFEGCGELETVFISDSVLYMDDSAFKNCGKLRTLNVLAVRNPTYTSTVLGTAGAIKYERLMTVEGPKLVHVSGSNGLYGLDSPRLESKLGKTYTVVNFSIHASFNATFALETINRVAGEGDIVVMSPEINGNQLGVPGFNATMWQCLEGAYDAVAGVDIGNYTKVFSSFAEYNRARANMTERNYRLRSTEITRNGDLSYTLKGTNTGYSIKQEMYLEEGGSISFLEGASLIKRYGESLNVQILKLREKGCETLLSFGTCDRCSLEEASGGYPKKQEDPSDEPAAENTETPMESPSPEISVEDSADSGEEQNEDPDGEEPEDTTPENARFYEEAADTYLEAVRISRVCDYVLEPEYFWNAEWHVNGRGRTIRTDKLAEDILAYFESLERGEEDPAGEEIPEEGGLE